VRAVKKTEFRQRRHERFSFLFQWLGLGHDAGASPDGIAWPPAPMFSCSIITEWPNQAPACDRLRQRRPEEPLAAFEGMLYIFTIKSDKE
jgi:hypothetical protein